MARKRHPIALLVLSLCLAAGGTALARKKDKPSQAPSRMDEHKRAMHALNRLTFGPRPGDLQQVMAIGVDHWIAEQLHPERIDDSALDARLVPLRTLRMSTKDILDNFPSPQMIKAVADGKRGMPSDSLKRAVYAAQLDRLEEKQERKQGAVADTGASADSSRASEDQERSGHQDDQTLAEARLRELLDMAPEPRFQATLRMTPAQQQLLLTSLHGRLEEYLEGMSPQQGEIIVALRNPGQVVADELMEGKLLRVVYSERQLQEVMADFWFNHFNVFMGKGADRYELTSYERDVIRPRALGKFEDLLVATAKSPAMLFYLDNWLSVGPNSDAANGISRLGDWKKRARTTGPITQSKGKRNGLNENYGRELMELHTVGVNGGYTQKDVTEVARVFTGWTLQQPQKGGGFLFDERMHEPGDKTVLGHRIKANGEKEGLEVLHLLARHPSTAKFICDKLATRFVSDAPPPALVDRMAQTYLKKDGDIREVLETMLKSPEFWAEDDYRAKVKTPLEFVASALRASDAEIRNAMPIVNQLRNMGMPLYGMQPATGYSMKASVWVNSSALLERMNFGLALAAGRLKGIRVGSMLAEQTSAPGGQPDASETLATLEDRLLAGDVSKQTHDTIAGRLQDPQISRRRLDDPARSPIVAIIEGLLLGSPEFQKR